MCDLDSLYRALADRKRRLAVQCLSEHRELTLPDLAELVTERECEMALHEVSEERVRDVYLTLYHRHIPILEDAQLLTYQQEHDIVVEADAKRATLRAAEEHVGSLL